MRRLIQRFALVICMLAVGAQASAQVELLSQSRSVSVDALVSIWGWWDSNSLSAPDFGLFEEDISAFSQGTWFSQAASSASRYSSKCRSRSPSVSLALWPARAPAFNSIGTVFSFEAPVATEEMAWGEVKALYR